MKIKVTKDLCEIKENEIWNVGDYNVHTVQVELSPEFNGLVNKVRYFVEDKSYDMLITDNVAQVPYEATVMEGTIKIGVYGYDADTDILVQSTSPVNKYISSGTYTGEADNTEPLTPTDKEQMETAIQKNTNDITDLKANKQDKLISGVNIKTINNESILSSGNLTLVTEETDPIFTNSPAYSITDNDITYWNNKANMSDIPDVSNFITKDVDNLTYYTKSTDMQTAINNAVDLERTARENADNSLQNQIDAITVSSDVVDIVSTYQDLVDYDTQHIKANDIIKVMQDSTHDNAISYYRWVIVNHAGSWEYVGSEGPYYTKSETDTLLNAKQNTLVSGQNIKTINNESLLGEGNINIQSGGTSDYEDLENLPKVNNVELKGNKSLNDLGIQPAGNYALESDMTEAQNDIDHLSKVSNLFEKITATGTSVTLNDTSDTIMKLNLDTTTSSQDTTTGKNLLPYENTSTTMSGVTITHNANGSITLNGTSTENIKYRLWSGDKTGILEENKSYVLSSQVDMPNKTLIRLQDSSSSSIFVDLSSQATVKNKISVKSSSFPTLSVSCFLFIYVGYTFNNYTIYPMLEEGTTATDYEPYTGGQPAPSPSYPQEIHTITGNNVITISNSDNTKSQTYPINLGDIEVCKISDYKDVIFKNTINSEYYNSSLELNKWYKLNRIGKVVLDGSETGWQLSSGTTNVFQNTDYFNGIYLIQDAFCNYYTNVVNSSITDNNRANKLLTNGQFTFRDGATKDRIYFKDTRYTSIYDFKTWLSTHNTIVYYVLETPTYTLLNDTLQTQLNNIQYALAYDTQTNISQTNTDLPFIINAETYQDISGKLDTSKVKNANSTTAGDVYDVRYINNMIGDVETILTRLTTGSGV